MILVLYVEKRLSVTSPKLNTMRYCITGLKKQDAPSIIIKNEVGFDAIARFKSSQICNRYLMF